MIPPTSPLIAPAPLLFLPLTQTLNNSHSASNLFFFLSHATLNSDVRLIGHFGSMSGGSARCVGVVVWWWLEVFYALHIIVLTAVIANAPGGTQPCPDNQLPLIIGIYLNSLLMIGSWFGVCFVESRDGIDIVRIFRSTFSLACVVIAFALFVSGRPLCTSGAVWICLAVFPVTVFATLVVFLSILVVLHSRRDQTPSSPASLPPSSVSFPPSDVTLTVLPSP